MALSMLIAALSWRYGMTALYLGLATGFIFIGPVLAVGLYSISAFSLPMIMDRKVDSVTAAVSSVNAVLCDKKPMLLWAGLIGLSVVIGFATALVGFAVLLPLIGHATWHAYLDTIDASIWPPNEARQRGHF